MEASSSNQSTRHSGIPPEELHERIKKLKVMMRLNLSVLRAWISKFQHFLLKIVNLQEEVMNGEIQAKFSRRKMNEESMEQKLKKAEALNTKGVCVSSLSVFSFFHSFIHSFIHSCIHSFILSVYISPGAHKETLVG